MRYFFFGSLMDREVLEAVLARPVATETLIPAWLRGYRRLHVHGEVYPLLQPDPAGKVEGRMCWLEGEEDRARIAFFEGLDYALEPLQVETREGRSVEAVLHAAAPDLVASDKPWTLADWPEQEKRLLIAVTRHFMPWFGKIGAEEIDAVWRRCAAEIA